MLKGVSKLKLRNFLDKPLRTFIAGLIAVLPLAITIAVIIWIGSKILEYFGPNSLFGGFLTWLGLPFGVSKELAYLIGILYTLIGIFVLGILVQAGLQKGIQMVIQSIVRRIPLVGSLYELMHRFVAMFDKNEEADFKSMSPVWCTFGGEGGASVLALLPVPDPVILHGHRYYVILVPTSPIPVGGGLICVPEAWVRPAAFGIEGLTSIYVSMGVALPKYVEALKQGQVIQPEPPAPAPPAST